MINGMSPSEISVVKKAHESHYRKLRQIIHSQHSSLSKLQPSFISVLNNRRFYHVTIKTISDVGEVSRTIVKDQQQVEYELNLQKQNQTQRQKLKMIRFGRSRYHFPHHPFYIKDSESSTKAHNFYLRKKRDFLIDVQNPEIAKRIINSHSSIDMNKSEVQFSHNRKIVKRLEKYPVIKRLEEYSEKRMVTLGIDSLTPDKSRVQNIVVRRQKLEYQ